MLTLSLLRHAKSSWSNPTLPDRDRPLATRGVTDAPLMGKAMGDSAGSGESELQIIAIS